MVSFDSPQVWTRLAAPPVNPGRLLAMVYDNLWYTNFWGNVEGTMEFQFDLVWRQQLAGDAEAAALAESLVTDPVMVINPSLPEHPLFLQHLYRP